MALLCSLTGSLSRQSRYAVRLNVIAVVPEEHHLRRLAPSIDFTQEYSGNGERLHLAGTSGSVSAKPRPASQSQLRPNGSSCLLGRSRVDPQVTVIRAASFGRLSGRSRRWTRSLTGSSPAILASSPGAEDTDRALRAYPRRPASEIISVIRRTGAICARKPSATR